MTTESDWVSSRWCSCGALFFDQMNWLKSIYTLTTLNAPILFGWQRICQSRIQGQCKSFFTPPLTPIISRPYVIFLFSCFSLILHYHAPCFLCINGVLIIFSFACALPLLQVYHCLIHLCAQHMH